MDHQVNLRNIWITMSSLCSNTGMTLTLTNESTAACDGKLMYMPKHWVYTSDPLIIEILLGVTIHEAMGHGRSTNFNEYQKFAGSTSELGRSIQNIFEDIYIETQCNKAKPGSSAALSKMVSILADKGFFGTPSQFAQNAQNRASLIVSGLLNLCRSRLLPMQDAPLKQNVDYLEIVLESSLGLLWEQIWDLAKDANKIGSSHECIILTQKVLDLISKTASEEPEKPENSDQKSSQSGDSDPLDDEDDKESLPNENFGNSDTGNEETSKGNDPDDLGSNQPENSSDNDVSQPGEIEDVEQQYEESIKSFNAAKNALKAENSAMPETEISKMASTEISKGSKGCAGSTIRYDDNPRKYQISEKALQIANSLKAISDDLQDALLAETRCVRSNRMAGKRLNSRILSRIRMGNPNIFVRKDIGEGMSTAVSILFDDSGSMTGGCDYRAWAHGLSYGLGDILEEFELPFEIAVYSDAFGYAKNFEDDWTNFSKQKKMVFYGDGTITGGAVELVLGSLACRQEERRLLILVTDGDTNDMDRLESAYAEATYQGIEIASVMLGPVIPKIQRLSNKFGFEAVSCTNENDFARYSLDRILKAI